MDFSVGILAYNEEANMEMLLRNLLTQPLEPESNLVEIVVILSGCNDRTQEIVRDFSERFCNVTFLTEEVRSGKASAFNYLLKRIKTDRIVVIGADNLPKKGSVAELVRKLSIEKVGAVGGRPRPVNDENAFWGYLANLVWSLHHEFCINEMIKISGEFFAFRSSLVQKLPENCINDDVYIQWNILRKGYKVAYAEKAISFMKSPDNIHEFIAQRRRIALGHIRIFKETARQFISPTYQFHRILLMIPRVIKPDLRGIFWIPIAVFLEMICHLMARYDSILSRIGNIWRVAHSTKRIELPQITFGKTILEDLTME